MKGKRTITAVAVTRAGTGPKTWPYGLGGVAIGLLATLAYVAQYAPFKDLPGATQLASIATIGQRTVAMPVVAPASSIETTMATSPESVVAMTPPDFTTAAATAETEVTGLGASVQPPYPSPIMPCRRLPNPDHQALAGPNGPPGFRCRVLSGRSSGSS